MRLLLPCLLLIAACNPPPPSPPPPTPTATPAPAAVATPTPIDRSGYHAAMLDPSQATQPAPETFAVKFVTTQGDLIIDVQRAWAPSGADRFYNLVQIGYFKEVAFFRAIAGFMAQFGIHGDPQVNAAWRDANIQDDPVQGSNQRGMVTFAKTNAPNSRSNQIFINLADNGRLDGMGFAPFGKVREESLPVLDKLYTGYGEGAPSGRGPNQMLVQSRGNEYLKAKFPQLDYIQSAELLP